MSPRLQEIASRLKDARLRLEFARNYLKELITTKISGPEEEYEYRNAVKAEREALRGYALILREYEDCLRSEAQRSKEQGA